MADSVDGNASTKSIIIPNSSTISAIDANGDSDWYQVTLTAGVQYQFDLMGAVADVDPLTLPDPWLGLRDSSGVLLRSDNDAGVGANARIFFIPSVSGIYYLDAQESGNDANGSYALIVNAAPTVNTLALGASATGTLGFAGDTDLYVMNLTRGVAYSFTLDGLSLSDPCMELLDSTGAVLLFDDNTGANGGAFLTYVPKTTGTYFLAARAAGNNASGSYVAAVALRPTISIADAKVTEADSGTSNLVFKLTLSAASPVDVSVRVGTSGTATASNVSDYLPKAATVTFKAGQTSATFTMQVLGDRLFEPTEALHVLLSNAVNAGLGVADAYGYIFDNDSPYKLPADPYLTYEWYLYPGTGVNAFPVWPDYTGAGIKVAVFDQGIDALHPDLDDNLLTALGITASTLAAGGAPVLTTDNHGTAVAGTIAAEKNGIGIVGVAYGAKLVSIYDGMTLAEIPNAFSYAVNFDVLNNSWGFAPQGTNNYAVYGAWAFADNFLTPAFAASGKALAALAANGRNGLGTVVVQSAGNSLSLGDDTNLHNFQNSQYITTVAATDYSGNVTSYSSPGASILVAAPGGGGTDALSEIYTTDRIGSAGYNTTNYVFEAGTSFSAPIVSGVVALMLQANPALGYRDVQEILAYSAHKVGEANNDWRYNGATNWNGGGLHFDAYTHNLGFGLVDARAAVRLAETWTTAPQTALNRQQVTMSHSPALTIPDNASTGMSDIIVVTESITVQRVEVTLNVTHPFIGDLSVFLISPSGTGSVLLWRPQQNALSAYGSSQSNINFTFDTVLGWGENSVGKWLIGIFDSSAGYVGTLDSWTLNLIGKAASADHVYFYTDEFAEACAADATRAMLADTGGRDTLNAAVCTSNLVLDLNPGSVSIVAGTRLTIAAGSVIENAYGGDGNDRISGNDADNILNGMRGADRFLGAGGNDVLDGGSGVDFASYRGVRANYAITAKGNSIIVSDSRGADGTDKLVNVERLLFADGAIGFDVDGAGGAAYRLYQAAFDRVPDAAGLGYWISLLDGGMSLATAANGFVSSAEFHDKYGANLGNAALVNQLYKNVLHRPGDLPGVAYWLGVLDANAATPAEVLTFFSEGFENQAALVGILGNGFAYTPFVT